MQIAEQRILSFVRFAELNKWSANSTTFEWMKSSYPLVPLSKVLKRVKKPITVENDKLYKRVTVRLYGQGAYKRDELYGKEIGTKRQFIAQKGQLILSRIDARNGAVGIVSKDLNGAIVTNDFWLFDVKGAMPQYLMLVLSSDRFQQYWQTQSSGTTNRQRVDEEAFLESRIILPAIEIQKSLLDNYNSKIELAQNMRDRISSLQHQIWDYLLKELHISFDAISSEGLISLVKFKEITRWDPQYLLNNISVCSDEKMVNLSDVISDFMVDTSGRSLRISPQNYQENRFTYIGMENVEKNTGKAAPQAVLGKDILSQTVRVPPNYVIYGKLRPYLNKYWENSGPLDNVICSSEFFVFNTKGVERKYFIEVLSSQIIQRQLSFLYTGGRMPRINESDFMGLRIPLPSKDKQIRIVEYILKLRNNICELEKQISLSVCSAKKDFEEAVFGEA